MAISAAAVGFVIGREETISGENGVKTLAVTKETLCCLHQFFHCNLIYLLCKGLKHITLAVQSNMTY